MGKRNPVWLARRGVKRFRRRSLMTQVRTVGLVAAIVAGTAIYVAAAPPSGPSGGGVAAAATNNLLSKASTSTRGIVGNRINVVFPVVALNSLSGKEGFAQDVEFGEQKKAITFFVNQVNQQGGVNGKKINPIIVNFDPTNATEERALCKTWTEGSPAAFAVVDGAGTWTGDAQLCVAQEGHTPLISASAAVTSVTQTAAPYLWWTSADGAAILQAVVNWGLANGLLAGRKVGVIVGDLAQDQAALNQYLLPDLQRAGVNPTIETLAAQTSETATTNSEAPLVVQKLKAAGVSSVIPLIPFNAFLPVVSAEHNDNYFPKLLLSDYDNSIVASLGLIPAFNDALNGQEGVTTETLGGFDDNRPQAQGGYDPGVRSCYNDWHAKYPKPVGGSESFFIEEQGPIQAWCTTIRLFAAAARNAGPNLNRRTFVEGLSKITNFPGGSSAVWTFGPNKFYGPTQYQVVQIHNNFPPSSACKLKTNGQPQGTCWVPVQPFQPLPILAPTAG